MVIVTRIWQKLSTVEREVTIIATLFWQLLSRIFSQTLLNVTHYWQLQQLKPRVALESSDEKKSVPKMCGNFLAHLVYTIGAPHFLRGWSGNLSSASGAQNDGPNRLLGNHDSD
jgi:hypothetical protein